MTRYHSTSSHFWKQLGRYVGFRSWRSILGLLLREQLNKHEGACLITTLLTLSQIKQISLDHNRQCWAIEALTLDPQPLQGLSWRKLDAEQQRAAWRPEKGGQQVNWTTQVPGPINHLLASGDSECADGDWSGAFEEPSHPTSVKGKAFVEEITQKIFQNS